MSYPSQVYISHKQIAICPITGIAITLDIPKLPFPLTYSSPLADARNFKSFADLPYPDLVKLHPHILAGAILAFLHSKKLVSDKCSSAERNQILCTASQAFLAKCIKSLSAFPFSSTKDYPHFSFEPFLSQEYIKNCGIQPAFRTFLLDLSKAGNLFVEEPESSRLYVSKVEVKTTKDKILTVRKETRNAVRDSILALKLNNLISDKFYSHLATLTIKDTLLFISQEIRQKTIDRLTAISHPSAETIIKILQETQDSKHDRQLDAALSRASNDVPKARKTLAEIIAEKKGISIEVESPQEQQEEQETSSEDNVLQILGELDEVLDEFGFTIEFQEDDNGEEDETE